MVELSRWLSRALQYTAAHPLTAQLGARTHEALSAALKEWTPLELGVLRDQVTLGAAPARHPALVSRLAPHLHERGVVVMRFVDGVTIEELASLIAVLTLSPADVFAGGGLRALLTDRRVAHVQVDEIGHELSVEDRERIRKEEQLRELFREMLMRLLSQGQVAADLGAHIAELAEHPDLAVRVIQSEPHVNLAEAVAGFTLILMQEEARRGEALLERMGPILMHLSPESRDKVLLGFPPLVGEFRRALGSAMDVLDETQLARFVFPSVRAHAQDLDATLYALGVVARDDDRRMEVSRRMSGLLYDLSLDEAKSLDLLHTLGSMESEEGASFGVERAALTEGAARILELRVPLHARPEDEALGLESFDDHALDRLSLRAAYDVVVRSARMVDFDKLCERLPASARSLSSEERAAAVAGMLLGLQAVREPRWAELAGKTLKQIARSGVGALALRAVERLMGRGDDAPIDDLLALARLVAGHNAEPVLELLERAESRRLRRALIDLLSEVGPDLLPAVQTRMISSPWYVTRNMVILHVRLGGSAAELRAIAEHPHAQVRVEVVRQLRALRGDPAGATIVAGRLSDPSPDVAQAAIASLATMDVPASLLASLEAIAADEDRADDARLAAVRVLGASREDAGADALIRLIQPRGLMERPSTTAVRERAARALRTCPAPGSAARFDEALRSSAWRVRKACERALEPDDG